MGELTNDTFLTKLQLLYGGTRKWGTVRLVVKRMFDEHHQHKKSKSKERDDKRVEESADPAKSFTLIVKASTTKRKMSTQVKAAEQTTF